MLSSADSRCSVMKIQLEQSDVDSVGVSLSSPEQIERDIEQLECDVVTGAQTANH